MKIRFEKKYTVGLLRKHPEDIFVFGDNLQKAGKGGQAIIRDEPNAFGVPTKRLPKRTADAYFSDLEEEKQAVIESLRDLYRLGKEKVLVFPEGGLGTGLALMKEKSPEAFKRMNEILETHFGVVFPEENTVGDPEVSSSEP